jgi:hypothetical protein
MVSKNQMLLMAVFGTTILKNCMAFNSLISLNGIGGATPPFASRNIRSTCSSGLSLSPRGLHTARRSAPSFKLSAAPENGESSTQGSLVDKVASKGKLKTAMQIVVLVLSKPQRSCPSQMFRYVNLQEFGNLELFPRMHRTL